MLLNTEYDSDVQNREGLEAVILSGLIVRIMRKGSSRGTLQSQNWRQLVKKPEVREEQLANGDVMDKPEIKHCEENCCLHKMRIWVKGKGGEAKFAVLKNGKF